MFGKLGIHRIVGTLPEENIPTGGGIQQSPKSPHHPPPPSGKPMTDALKRVLLFYYYGPLIGYLKAQDLSCCRDYLVNVLTKQFNSSLESYFV